MESMNRGEFRFFERLRVRWAEVDMQKIVFNGHYLMYFDTAVAGYWRAMAMPYHETMDYLDGDLYVRKATLEYEGSARYDDKLDVGMRCARIGNSSILFGAAVFRGETLLVGGELVYVFADPKTQTSLPVPAQLRELLQAFEAGKPMVDVRLGTWDELRPRGAAHPQRRVRAGAADPGRAGMGRGRRGLRARRGLQPLRHGAGHRPAARARAGRGQDRPHGRAAGDARRRHRPRAARRADATARASAATARCCCTRRSSAAGFYTRAGFTTRGSPFDEAGIAHVEMVRAL